jgi:hypothetical protein
MTTVRRAGTASAAVLTGLVLTLGLTHATAPEWTRRAGLDVWKLAEARDAFQTTADESVRIRDEAERLRESIEAVDHITTRLVAGDLTLSDATDVTEPLLRERRGFSFAAESYYAAPTFRMSVGRYLIDRARRVLSTQLSRSTTVLARLEGEYATMR